MKVVLYQPGNGTRYEMYVQQILDPKIAMDLCISPKGWFIAWVNQRCRAFQPAGYLDLYNVMDAFGVNEADGEALLNFVAYITDRPVKDPWPKCKHCGMPVAPYYEFPYCVTCVFMGDPDIHAECLSIKEGE